MQGPEGAIRENDPGRIEKLVQENLGWLRGWLRGRLKDPEAVDDLCQESLLKAIRRFPELRDPARFPAWLYRIAENTLRDHLRAESRLRKMITFTGEIDEDLSAEPPRDPEMREDAEKLLGAIRSLPPRLREPLLLKHSRDLSYKEIGAILGIRENAVQVRIFRARRILRKKIQESTDGTRPPSGGEGTSNS